MAMSNTLVIWRRPDDTFETQYIVLESIPKNVREDDHINSLVNSIKSKPNYLNKQCFLKTKSDLREAAKLVYDGNKRRLKIDSSGNFYPDNSFKLPIEIYAEKQEAIKLKLVSGERLTSDEAEFLLGIKK